MNSIPIGTIKKILGTCNWPWKNMSTEAHFTEQIRVQIVKEEFYSDITVVSKPLQKQSVDCYIDWPTLSYIMRA